MKNNTYYLNQAKLTVLIPFMNEREEVAATVKDVRRTAGGGVDIVVLNDCSTDGYDYEAELKPYNVTYLSNKENKGSAPSRDICVNNCQTPYFLFLDAHMRFFCEDWAEKIVSLLEENDRQLLCLQTVSLEKDKAGVHINPKHVPVFGAFMPLNVEECQPDIKWNRKEFDPKSDTQEIPMVLGAAYAGSKRYWQYLRGMEGLMRYGTEEQCISLKVWLEGGRCLLLKDLKVGHIYRKKSPFKRYADVEIFNKLWVASLLFPEFLKCRAFAVAQKKTKDTFFSALEILKSKEAELKGQRAYFSKIFTRPFEVVILMNRKVLLANIQDDFKERKELLPQIAQFIDGNVSDYYGLFNGKMGQILWLEHYSRYSKDQRWDDLATMLWESIQKAIDDRVLPWYFATGLTGIGWALHYLYNHSFIDVLPNETLREIDKAIMEIDLDSLKDTSIDFGLAGILAYCSVRWLSTTDNPFTEAFCDKLSRATDLIINNSDDVRELSFAYIWIDIRNNNSNDATMQMSVSSVLEPLTNFAHNPAYWDNTLAGAVLSSTLITLYLFSKSNL